LIRRPGKTKLEFAVLPFSFGAAIGLLSAALSVSASEQANPLSERPLRSTSELVKLEVRVTDKHGSFVVGLGSEDFRILDNGVEQARLFFAPVDSPTQVLVMIETSPAVYLIRSEHLLGAYTLVNGLAPDDEVALITYDRVPHVVLPFTADKPLLLRAIGSIEYDLGVGELNFYDAVSTVLDWLAPRPGKKALVLLSTGLDSSPPSGWKALTEKLRARDIVIFPVALGGSLRTYAGEKSRPAKGRRESDSERSEGSPGSAGSLSFLKADQALHALATATGGRAYFPLTAKDFAPLYAEIASTLRHEYVLGIAPAHDGQFHSLRVQVVGRSGGPRVREAGHFEYRVAAREGYLAPGP
jgi:Ca-activated chloride channel family protein